jgi:toxin ParE1/3/4
VIVVEFLPAAHQELLTAAGRYDSQAPRLGADFIDEVEWALDRIAGFPEHGSPYLVGTRRVLLRRFPFGVVYVLESSRALVVAVAHYSRRPGYWRRRL